METPSDPRLELSTATHWHGVQLGMSRAAVLALLTPEMRAEADDEGDPAWMIIGEWELDLTFAEGGEQRLQQISTGSEDYHWKGTPLLGRPFHAALEALAGDTRAAAWHLEDPLETEFVQVLPGGPSAAPSQEPVTDRDLLEQATLWLPARRWGLSIRQGRVAQLSWRLPEYVPRETLGGVTEAQLALSRLAEDAPAEIFAEPPSRRRSSPLALPLTVVYVLGLIGLGVYAFQEQQQWQTAAHAPARVTQIESPSHTNGYATAQFHVEFTEARGARQTARLAGPEFYVAPRVVGDEVEVTYLPTEPMRVKGPAYARDAALLRYVPWFIGLTLGYGVLLTVAGWLAPRSGVQGRVG